ncbi:MAG: c-type cytochrome, partial [Pirellulales bacterium]|nr:c-type cytochrome [Pirellulales bacterium]
PARRLDAVRVMQRVLGDVFLTSQRREVLPGYTALFPGQIEWHLREPVADRIAGELATTEPELRRELARLLAMLPAASSLARKNVADLLTPDGDLVDDVHFLTVLACITGADNDTTRSQIAAALVGLHAKLAAVGGVPSREWPAWVGGVFARLVELDPALAPTVVDRPEFGAAEHALYAEPLDAKLRRVAADKIVARLIRDDAGETRITPEIVQLARSLDDGAALRALRIFWDRNSARDAVAIALAAYVQGADRPRLLEALSSTDAGVVRRVAEALAAMPNQLDDAQAAADEATALVGALDRRVRSSGGAEQERAKASVEREACAALVVALERLAGQSFGIDAADQDLQRAYAPCFAWYEQAYPEDAQRQKQRGAGADWAVRLASAPWETADVARGRVAYERKSCAGCHAGADRLGPDLTGVTARLTREDLFLAIVAPNRAFSPQYEATLAVTRSGQIHQGMIVYESPEGTLLRTGAATTVRIDGSDLVQLEPSGRSFMPEGLLDQASDQELADLYAYLQTLQPQGGGKP